MKYPRYLPLQTTGSRRLPWRVEIRRNAPLTVEESIFLHLVCMNHRKSWRAGLHVRMRSVVDVSKLPKMPPYQIKVRSKAQETQNIYGR